MFDLFHETVHSVIFVECSWRNNWKQLSLTELITVFNLWLEKIIARYYHSFELIDRFAHNLFTIPHVVHNVQVQAVRGSAGEDQGQQQERPGGVRCRGTGTLDLLNWIKSDDHRFGSGTGSRFRGLLIQIPIQGLKIWYKC